MARSATYQIRIDEQDKTETFAILYDLGITPAQALCTSTKNAFYTFSY